MMDLVLDTWATVIWKACWQGGLVVLAVWLICLAIPSMPARCRCWLWRLAILKFIVVLLLPTLVNLPLLPAPTVAAPIREVAVQVVTLQVPVRPTNQVDFRPRRAIELPSFPAILALVWIIGVGWSSARLSVAWRGTRRLRKQSRMIDNIALIEQLAIQAKPYRLRASPAFLKTEGNGSPMLIGIFRPAIVVPGGTLRKLSPPELAMALGHELAHIRRGDLLWGLAAAGVRALFFFHPLVWLCQRRLNLAQEVAADELAIIRQNHDPASYGKLLVSIISKIGPSRLIPTMSMGTAGSIQSLTRRLVAMANIGRASRGIIVTSGILLAATVLLGIVPWRLVAAEPKVSESPKEPPKVTLPAYRIEPPDVIVIEMAKAVPLPSYRTAVQPVTGQYLVGPDGTINLRQYGVVHISGKTVAETCVAIQNHLKQFLDSPELSVKVVAYNSHVYYVISEGPGIGDNVRRLPATGEERVSDPISQIEGLSELSSKKIWISRPVPHRLGDQQILPVEWDAVAQRVQAATNYQLLPGDRVFVSTSQNSSIGALPHERDNPVDANYRAYGSIPAGSEGDKQQQVAAIKTIPPATPATVPLTLREHQRLAKIEVWERKKGQPKVILNRPQIVFVVGQEAKVQAFNEQMRLEIVVRSLADTKPIQHVIELKLIRDPEGKNPVTLMAPKLTLADDQTGGVSGDEADGSKLGMEVTISSFITKTTLETLDSGSDKQAAEPKAFVNIGVGNDGREVGVPIAEVRTYASEHVVSEKEAGKQMLIERIEMAEIEKKQKDDAGQTVPKTEKKDAWGDISVSCNGRHITLSEKDRTASSFRVTGDLMIKGKGFTGTASALQYDAEKNVLTLLGGITDCTLFKKNSDGTLSTFKAERMILSPFSGGVTVEGRVFRGEGMRINLNGNRSKSSLPTEPTPPLTVPRR